MEQSSLLKQAKNMIFVYILICKYFLMIIKLSENFVTKTSRHEKTKWTSWCTLNVDVRR